MSTDGKARIVDAAMEVISRNGISGASMRNIAEEAGVTTGAIYHHYKNKEDVLFDVMDERLSVSSKIADKSRLSECTRDEIIDEIYENILHRFKKDAENRLQFYFAHEAMIGNNELKEKFNNKYSQWINKTEELIKYLYSDKSNKYNKALASLLIGAIDGVVMQYLLNANQVNIEEISKVYLLLLKEGIPNFMDKLEHIDDL